MATREEFKTSTIDYYKDSGPLYGSRNRIVRRQNVSAKVKGVWKTFSDGSKFRKATAYYKQDSWLQDGSVQITNTKTAAGVRYHAYSSPGGYRSDIILTTMPVPQTSVGSYALSYGPCSIPTAMQNEAVTKALNKIADQKVNLGEGLATMGQTARLFADSANLLRNFLQGMANDKSMRKYLFQSYREMSRNAPKHLARKYLEYVYGWKPLMQDVYSLYKLANNGSNRPLLINGRGSCTQQATGGIGTFNDASFNATTKLGPANERATVRCSIWAQIDPQWAGLRALNQLGLLNPASLAWELTPWSFVVDWLVPIGPVLSAMSAPAGLIFVDASVAVRTSATTPFEHWYNDQDNYTYQYTNQHATGVHRSEGYRRVTYSSWPLPGLWFDQDPFRGDRPFKAIALAILQLGGSKRNLSRLG